MEKETLGSPPTYTDSIRPWHDRRRRRRAFRLFAVACLAYFALYVYRIARNTGRTHDILSIEQLHSDYATCATLRRVPVSANGGRELNKRWVNGTKPLLIQNATIWTGQPEHGTSEEDARLGKGYAWISSDVFVDHGLIKEIKPDISIEDLPSDTEIFEANGRQLTAGIVDMHSHAGLMSVGNLQDDVNELSKDITPYVRSIDALDPLHPEFQWIKSGGVTTSLILPGSGNNMGGEAFVVKFAVGEENGRAEISQQDMLADPDKNWRYMKMACGENPKSVYGKAGEHGPYSRLGESWAFRHALEQARDYVLSQDEWCAAADVAGAENMEKHLPQELKWESLGAVLRGQVRVNTHCYTIPDLEAFVRHTNEFKFRVYAFHHAHQTFLIPEVLKRAWGGTPAAALFADNMYYKVEAYTASEKAGKILYQNGITPTYVSDNPVLNSQHVVFEAAKAYGNGLPYHAALAGVTSAPAELLGLGHRIGKIVQGYDADIVVWDSDPLSAGATPVQVWIDGASQFKDPIELEKPLSPPITPDESLGDDAEMKEVAGRVVLTGIRHNFVSGSEQFDGNNPTTNTVVIMNGRISCTGTCEEDVLAAKQSKTIVNLKNGYITRGFTSFGSQLGLVEIDQQPQTHDGSPPSDGITRAVDGLTFGGKQLARAFEHGVTKAISAPSTGSWDAKGISVSFNTEAKNVLGDGAVLKDETALHYTLTIDAKDDKTTSISSAISLLRNKLLDAVDELAKTGNATSSKERYEEKSYLKRVVSGTLPLVLSVHSADTISSIIKLKSDIEAAVSESASPSFKVSHAHLRFIILGGAESHLVATALADANIAVVVAPLLPHAQSWDQRRGLTGAPITNGTAIDALFSAGVLVGIGVEELWETRDLGLLAGIAYRNSGGNLGLEEALNLVSTNFEKMLGIEEVELASSRLQDWVVWEGSPLEVGGRLKAAGGTGRTILWE